MRTRGTAVLAAGCAVHVTCAACGALVWLGLRMCTGVARARQLLLYKRVQWAGPGCGSRMRVYHACACHIFDNVNVCVMYSVQCVHVCMCVGVHVCRCACV